MDWKTLYFGPVTRQEVQQAVKDEFWQRTRLYMKGISTEDKFKVLRNYLQGQEDDRMVQVRVTNYVTALSRGGLIKPTDYLGGQYDKKN